MLRVSLSQLVNTVYSERYRSALRDNCHSLKVQQRCGAFAFLVLSINSLTHSNVLLLCGMELVTRQSERSGHQQTPSDVH